MIGLWVQKGYLSPSWDWDFSAKVAQVYKNETQKNNLLTKEITNLIVDGSYDPFLHPEKNISGGGNL